MCHCLTLLAAGKISSIQPKTVLGDRKMSCLVELQTGIFTPVEAPGGTSTNAGNSSSPSGRKLSKMGSKSIVPPFGHDLT